MMLWQDVLTARRVDPSLIAGAVGDAFGVPATDVVVVDDLEETLTRVTPQTPVLVQRTTASGEFPMLLSVYVLDGDIKRQIDAPGTALPRLRHIARSLHANVLVSDETTPGDESWLLVRPGGSVERVLLDADAMDREEYRITEREAPATVPVPA